MGETISLWVGAQRLLHDSCISSLVFDYTGSGDSAPGATVARLDEDAASAYAFLAGRLAAEERLYVLGFSMGSGPMLAALARARPESTGAVVASAFTSVRDLAVAWGLPRLLAPLLPDDWHNAERLAAARVPVLVLWSDADRTIPPWMGEALFARAAGPKHRAIVRGLGHTAAYREPSLAWWGPVIEFVRGTPGERVRHDPVR
jgi:fermentation-respiration switch protein FrsA (DUF1100 family)